MRINRNSIRRSRKIIRGQKLVYYYLFYNTYYEYCAYYNNNDNVLTFKHGVKNNELCKKGKKNKKKTRNIANIIIYIDNFISYYSVRIIHDKFQRY